MLTRLGRDFVIQKPIKRNLSFRDNWDGSHILYRKKKVHENVHFIQEKYFEFSWNLANIYFVNVSTKFFYLHLHVFAFYLISYGW